MGLLQDEWSVGYVIEHAMGEIRTFFGSFCRTKRLFLPATLCLPEHTISKEHVGNFPMYWLYFKIYST